MGRKAHFGTCCICGEHRKLTFEHVPPRSAFNDRPVVRSNYEQVLENLESPRGKTQQRGMGGYTLCGRCNNDTGRWYGGAFVDWAYQTLRILSYTQGRPSLYYTYHLLPLRVIKQIVCMFFSVNGPEFQAANPELVRFVLNKERVGMAPKYRIYTYFAQGTRCRSTGVTGSLNIGRSVQPWKASIMSEFTFPPMGYLMSFDTDQPDDRLVDITFMAKSRYNDFRHLSLDLPVLPVYTAFPADYRDKETVEKGAEQARQWSQEHGIPGRRA